MNLRPVLFVMLLAAMGPGKSEAPPQGAQPAPASPEDLAPPPGEAAAPAAPGVELQILPADNAAPGDFLWSARPLIVFADTPRDPAFVEQMQVLRSRPDMLIERDVVVITDTDPAAGSDWRDALRPEGFSLVLMDKDGQVKLRKPFPWSVREISRAIDKFPLRRQEIGRAGLTP